MAVRTTVPTTSATFGDMDDLIGTRHAISAVPPASRRRETP